MPYSEPGFEPSSSPDENGVSKQASKQLVSDRGKVAGSEHVVDLTYRKALFLLAF
jgi:hypothetical protein